MIINTRNTIPSKQWQQLIVQNGQRCAYCNTINNPTVDHRLARAFGGTNKCSNLQILCKPYNWQKAAEKAYLLALLQTVVGRTELWRQFT